MLLGKQVAGPALALALLAGCGSANDPIPSAPEPGADGLVDAAPRALAATVIEHVHAGRPRRELGSWSDYLDPLQLSAQVDYGVDPEGSESGETRTVRISVSTREGAEAAGYDLTCAEAAPHQCEQQQIGGATVLFRWDPGSEEEEPGTFRWTVVRDEEVVMVSYEGSGLFRADPRTLDVPIDPDELRDAALDPAMSLRTTPAAYAAGQQLTDYRGEEHPPDKPSVARTTPKQIADEFVRQAGVEPSSVRASTRDDFGPDAVGAHLEYAGTSRYDPFSVDVLSTPGRASQLDPPPCGVQHSATAVRDKCFGLDADTFVTWQLTRPGTPGFVWILSVQYNDDFNRYESTGIRIESPGLTQDFYAATEEPWTARFPLKVWSNVLWMGSSIRPAVRVPD